MFSDPSDLQTYSLVVGRSFSRSIGWLVGRSGIISYRNVYHIYIYTFLVSHQVKGISNHVQSKHLQSGSWLCSSTFPLLTPFPLLSPSPPGTPLQLDAILKSDMIDGQIEECNPGEEVKGSIFCSRKMEATRICLIFCIFAYVRMNNFL